MAIPILEGADIYLPYLNYFWSSIHFLLGGGVGGGVSGCEIGTSKNVLRGTTEKSVPRKNFSQNWYLEIGKIFSNFPNFIDFIAIF